MSDTAKIDTIPGLLLPHLAGADANAAAVELLGCIACCNRQLRKEAKELLATRAAAREADEREHKTALEAAILATLKRMHAFGLRRRAPANDYVSWGWPPRPEELTPRDERVIAEAVHRYLSFQTKPTWTPTPFSDALRRFPEVEAHMNDRLYNDETLYAGLCSLAASNHPDFEDRPESPEEAPTMSDTYTTFRPRSGGFLKVAGSEMTTTGINTVRRARARRASGSLSPSRTSSTKQAWGVCGCGARRCRRT